YTTPSCSRHVSAARGPARPQVYEPALATGLVQRSEPSDAESPIRYDVAIRRPCPLLRTARTTVSPSSIGVPRVVRPSSCCGSSLESVCVQSSVPVAESSAYTDGSPSPIARAPPTVATTSRPSTLSVSGSSHGPPARNPARTPESSLPGGRKLQR